MPAGTTQTHALTLISDPYLYINTAVINAGGTGYAVNDVITLNGGTFISPAQFTVTEVDVDAVIEFTTTAGAVTNVTLVSGGSGYPLSSSGTFSITTNSDPGYVAGTLATVDWTTDGTGAIITAVINAAGSGYSALTDAAIDQDDLPLQNGANSGAISAVNFDFAGEYVVFPNPATGVTTAGGTGSGATFDITKAAPRLEIIGITTTGGTPASPVDATNLGSPDDTTVFGLYDTKTVSGENQVLNFKSISEGSNITMSVAGDTVQISAATPTFAETTVGGGTSLFDEGTISQTAPTFRKLIAGTSGRIALSVDNGGVNRPIAISYNFAYSAPTSAATLTYGTEIPSAARLVDVTPFAGGTTLNLPAGSSVTQGDTITIKDGAGTALANNIIVTPNGTDQIDGVNAAVTLNTNRAYITLFSDGTHWHIIGQG